MPKIIKHSKGFTLIELLIVISIIALLAAVGIATYAGTRPKARDSRRIGDIKDIMTALERYANENELYPNITTKVDSNDTQPWLSGIENYLGGKVPQEPKYNTNCPYDFVADSDRLGYTMNYYLETTINDANAIGAKNDDTVICTGSTDTFTRFTVRIDQ